MKAKSITDCCQNTNVCSDGHGIMAMVNAYRTSESNFKIHRKRLQDEIEIKKNELNQLLDSSPNWIKDIVKPLANKLKPFFPETDRIDVLGPFGLGSEVSIHIGDIHTDEFYFVTFRPGVNDSGQFELLMKDYEHQKPNYPINSIGDVNGFNYSDVLVPDSIEELAKFMRENQG